MEEAKARTAHWRARHRPRLARAVVEDLRRIPKRHLALIVADNEELEQHERPRTRGDCVGGERPCPYISCRHHLFLDVRPNGNVKLNFPDVDPEDMHLLPDTCSLDVADAGPLNLSEVGERMNVVRERVRQVEEHVLGKLRPRQALRALAEGVGSGGRGQSALADLMGDVGGSGEVGDDETTSTSPNARHRELDAEQAYADRVWRTYETRVSSTPMAARECPEDAPEAFWVPNPGPEDQKSTLAPSRVAPGPSAYPLAAEALDGE